MSADRYCTYCGRWKPTATFVKKVVGRGSRAVTRLKCADCEALANQPVEVRDALSEVNNKALRAQRARAQRNAKENVK